MKSPIEYFDVVVNTQKQVIGNVVSAQKELHAQLIDATEKVAASIATLPVVSEIPAAQKVLDQFNSWLNSVSKDVDLFKFQESLLGSYEKQVENTRSLLKNLVDISVKTTA